MTRMFGSATMYVIGKRMPKKYDIQGDLREALYQAANEWIDAIGNKDFLGGNKPNLADLSVYRVIGAIHGTQTLLTIDGFNMLQGDQCLQGSPREEQNL